ncbi:MAG TPA: adenylate/guanylate cyclase domain-containing protein [Acidimicrobiales bacterium]|jgi:class 3 adenylate cyclase|nr:adenylate/guanylate cyclase domain-containing protein [Acidimicrobiales bacterium]
MSRASGAAGRGRRAAPLRGAGVVDVDVVDDELEVLPREDPEPAECVAAAVMFTDVAPSRARVPSIDERTWPELVDEYRSIVRRQAARYNGTRVQSHEGAFVRFSGPYSAVRCALAIRRDLHDLNLDLRAGLHAGDGKVRDADITDVIAHVASRICCIASSGRVLASQVLAEHVAGLGLVFDDAGTYRLDDFLGDWHLLAVRE